jgi:tRNA/rRNA methyltransferase
MSLRNCRVVLVRTKIAANLGATARVMRNMGLDQLVLVSPEADPADREARRLSTQGEDILYHARIVSDVGEAVADCRMVAATSARTGNLIRRQCHPPDEIAPHLTSVLASGPAALVFGPEPGGLTDQEVARCNYLIRIPTDLDYPALNLAQAVAICLYELRRNWIGLQPSVTARERPASFAEQERMFDHLATALKAIHFLYGPTADSLMHGLRNVIARSEPTDKEVGLLFGLARQIQWFAAKYGSGTECESREVSHE